MGFWNIYIVLLLIPILKIKGELKILTLIKNKVFGIYLDSWKEELISFPGVTFSFPAITVDGFKEVLDLELRQSSLLDDCRLLPSKPKLRTEYLLKITNFGYFQSDAFPFVYIAYKIFRFFFSIFRTKSNLNGFRHSEYL